MPSVPATPVVRPLVDADLPRLIELNTAAVPAVNLIGEDAMRMLVEAAQVAVGVIDPAHPELVLGFVIALPPGVDYTSENYRWFSARGDRFLYVDRVVVADGSRSAGLGGLLYETVIQAAQLADAVEIDCEVNIEPPNPGSLAFHARLGFSEVGRQATKGGSVVVALLARPAGA